MLNPYEDFKTNVFEDELINTTNIELWVEVNGRKKYIHFRLGIR